MAQLTNTWYKKSDRPGHEHNDKHSHALQEEKKNHVPIYTRAHTHTHSIFKYSRDIFNHRSIRVVGEIMQENLLKKENPHSWKPQITSMTHEAELLPLSGEYRRNAQKNKKNSISISPFFSFLYNIYVSQGSTHSYKNDG